MTQDTNPSSSKTTSTHDKHIIDNWPTPKANVIAQLFKTMTYMEVHDHISDLIQKPITIRNFDRIIKDVLYKT